MDWDKESYPSLHSLNIHLLIMCWWSSLIGGSSGLIEFYVDNSPTNRVNRIVKWSLIEHVI
jgi:hypothetical protein